MIGVLWIVAMKFKGGLTFGTSLGPLLFIAVVRKLPFGVYGHFKIIEVVYFFLSMLILDNSILSYIEVCTPITTGVGQHALNYIGPVVIVIMMTVIILASYCCPRYLHKITESPLQMICLLGLVTFWSLASTSINLILPLKLGNSYWFAIDPNVPIKSNSLAFLLISVLVLILVLSIVVFMTVSPYISKCFNTLRIKPILDVCQSCYKDKWRWYSMVYFTVWMIITAVGPYSVPFLNYLYWFMLIGVATIHSIFRPYAFKWLNIADTLLLIDLIMLYATVAQIQGVEAITRKEFITTVIILFELAVFVLSLLPPLVYLIFGMAVLLKKLPCLKKRFEKFSKELTTTADMNEDDDANKRDSYFTIIGGYQSLRLSQCQEVTLRRDSF